MPLTGYEETSVVEVGAVLDTSPATAEEVYLRTMAYSERSIAAVAAKRAGSGGGGATTFSGFLAYLSDPAGWDSDGGNVPYDATSFDTDTYWSAGAKQAAIPAGKAGVYAVSHSTYIADVSTLAGVTGLINSGTPDVWENQFDFNFVKTRDQSNNLLWGNPGTFYGRYAEGDVISFAVGWYPLTIPSINIGSASYLTAILLGNPA